MGDLCRCSAYRFPHRYGSGKCLTPELRCANCGAPDLIDINGDDTGANWYESTCCGDAVINGQGKQPAPPVHEIRTARQRHHRRMHL